MAMELDRRSALTLAGAALLTTAMARKPATAVLSGTVYYRERMALPPEAMVQVQLADVSRADAPAQVIAETQVPAGPGTPTSWSLEYPTALIEAGHSYALSARITVGTELMFLSTERHAVLTGGADRTDILVHRAGGEPEATRSPVGIWMAEEIGGTSAAATVISTLEIAADGTVSGKGGCNSYGGSVKISEDRIMFDGMRSTMMACAGEAMGQEQRFFAALAAARSFRIEGKPRTLVLTDEAGIVVLRLERA